MPKTLQKKEAGNGSGAGTSEPPPVLQDVHTGGETGGNWRAAGRRGRKSAEKCKNGSPDQWGNPDGTAPGKLESKKKKKVKQDGKASEHNVSNDNLISGYQKSVKNAAGESERVAPTWGLGNLLGRGGGGKVKQKGAKSQKGG